MIEKSFAGGKKKKKRIYTKYIFVVLKPTRCKNETAAGGCRDTGIINGRPRRAREKKDGAPRVSKSAEKRRANQSFRRARTRRSSANHRLVLAAGNTIGGRTGRNATRKSAITISARAAAAVETFSAPSSGDVVRRPSDPAGDARATTRRRIPTVPPAHTSGAQLDNSERKGRLRFYVIVAGRSNRRDDGDYRP